MRATYDVKQIYRRRERNIEQNQHAKGQRKQNGGKPQWMH
jgi:hypothetical protein